MNANDIVEIISSFFACLFLYKVVCCIIGVSDDINININVAEIKIVKQDEQNGDEYE